MGLDFRQKLAIGFGLAFLLFLLSGYLIVSDMQEAMIDRVRGRQINRSMHGLEKLFTHLLDAETSQRGYLLTGKADYLKPYLQASAIYPQDVEAVRKLLSDPAEKRRFADIKALCDEKVGELRQTTDLARQGHRQAALAMLETDAGEHLMAEIRKRVTRMEDEKEHLLNVRRDKLNRNSQEVYWLVMISRTFTALILLSLYALTHREIMQRERAEASLEKSNKNLQQRTADLLKSNVALETVIEQLRAAETQRNMFVSTLTHDLRTPLIAQRRVLELLNEDFVDRTDTESARLAKGLLDNNDNLLGLVGKILETAQLEDGRMPVSLEDLALKPLVDECIQEIATLAEAKGITIHNEISADLPVLPADASLLRRVFQNLLGNAIAHLQVGGAITLTASVQDNYCDIQVRDNGPGIDADIKPHLFERYFMGTTKQKIGSGLGLFICRLIVELHGGRIRAESEPGRGATFLITLPLQLSGDFLSHSTQKEAIHG